MPLYCLAPTRTPPKMIADATDTCREFHSAAPNVVSSHCTPASIQALAVPSTKEASKLGGSRLVMVSNECKSCQSISLQCQFRHGAYSYFPTHAGRCHQCGAGGGPRMNPNESTRRRAYSRSYRQNCTVTSRSWTEDPTDKIRM
jgi:hypothetical protein